MTDKQSIRRLLIANRGEIAVRIARTAKRMGIQTVAVHSEADAEALHVRVADEALPIGASRAQESYLNQTVLLEAVAKSGADAVHPGYGLLSEDASFADAVRGSGVRFVGPSGDAMRALGDKLQARALAAKCGLSHAPGTDKPLPQDEAEVLEQARGVGFPLMVKASAGGGGIGMAIAREESEVFSAVKTCRARAKAAFADERVYLERYLQRPRHIEVQLIADQHGAVRAIGDRECSVQRRHQKVIEEAPAPASWMTPERRSSLYHHAERLLSSVGYEGAATVEFIADASMSEPELYFLEVNARLQVEHPVTELVTGLDLVEVQLRIAMGEPLQEEWAARVRGAAVEARIYAEDPMRRFMPQPGRIEEVRWAEGLRVDAGYEAGDQITPFYDPLLAKVVAHGATRTEAIARLRSGLLASRIDLQGPKGPRVTNLAFCSQVLESPAFQSGDYDTHLVDDLLDA